MHAGVDDGVGVPVLTTLVARLHCMSCFVVVEGFRADQAMDEPLDPGQTENLANGMVFPHIVEGGAAGGAGDAIR